MKILPKENAALRHLLKLQRKKRLSVTFSPDRVESSCTHTFSGLCLWPIFSAITFLSGQWYWLWTRDKMYIGQMALVAQGPYWSRRWPILLNVLTSDVVACDFTIKYCPLLLKGSPEVSGCLVGTNPFSKWKVVKSKEGNSMKTDWERRGFESRNGASYILVWIIRININYWFHLDTNV